MFVEYDISFEHRPFTIDHHLFGIHLFVAYHAHRQHIFAFFDAGDSKLAGSVTHFAFYHFAGGRIEEHGGGIFHRLVAFVHHFTFDDGHFDHGRSQELAGNQNKQEENIAEGETGVHRNNKNEFTLTCY